MHIIYDHYSAALLVVFAVAQCCGSAVASDETSDRFQRHLVGTGDPSEMVISWATNRSCPHSTVALEGVGNFSAASSRSFNTVVPWTCTKLPQPTANESVGNMTRLAYLHDAKLVGLGTDQRYSYRVGSDLCGWSDPAMFSTAEPKRLVVLADFGHQAEGPKTHAALRELLSKQAIDGIIHAGDFAYDFEGEYYKGDAVGGDLSAGIAPRHGFVGRAGDRFMEQIGTYAKSIPYFPAPGNHETCHDNCECHPPFQFQYTMAIVG